MKRILASLLLLPLLAAGQYTRVTNDVIWLDPAAHPIRGTIYRQIQYDVVARRTTNVVDLTGYTVTMRIYDGTQTGPVHVITGEALDATAGVARVTWTPANVLDGWCEIVSDPPLPAGRIAWDYITVTQACSSCAGGASSLTVTAVLQSVSGGGISNLITSGSVTGSISDDTLFLTGAASGASSGGMVVIDQWDLRAGGWSNKFDAIPQIYPAVRLLGCVQQHPAAGPTNSYNVFFRVNDDTNSRYSRHYQRWTDGAVQSPNVQLSNTIGVLSAIYDAPGNVAYIDLTIPCYASTNAWKTYFASGVAWGGNKVDQFIQPGRYMDTNPVVSLTVFHSAMSNFTAGTLTLYGLPAP